MATIADRQDKGTRILQAAIRVFAEKGFKAAALEQVARQAGTAKGTLYLYFRDKQELYYRAALQVFDDVRAHIDACAAQASGPVEKLRAIARAQLEYFTMHRDAMRLAAGIMAPGLGGLRKRLFVALMERRQKGLEALTAIVEEAKRQGLIRGDIGTRDLVLSYVGVLSQAGQEQMMQAGHEAACGHTPLPATAEASGAASGAAGRADVLMKILMEGMAPRRS